MIRPALIAAAVSVVAAVLAAPATPAGAAIVCYAEAAFPAVSFLERHGEGLRIVLGPKWLQGEDTREGARAPTMIYDKGRWVLGDPAPLWRERKPPDCASLIPPIPLSVEEAFLLRPHVGQVLQESLKQDIGACQQVGNVVWFGIAFYDGEGEEGVGGVGRYDLESKKLEVHRPQELRDASVTHLVRDGDSLWLATTADRECIGEPPVSGLIRYDWDKRDVSREYLCGFVYHGMTMLNGELWVASDLGLARGRRDEFGLLEWENFIPTPEGPELLERVTCNDLYTRLLDTLPRTVPAGDDRSPWSQFFRTLTEFEPGFLEEFVNGRTSRPAPSGTPPAPDAKP